MTSTPEHSTANAVDPEQQKASRRIMMLVFAVFLMPVLVAYSAHFFGWYTSIGTNNHGFLITPPIEITDLKLTSENGKAFDNKDYLRTWFLVYVMPQQCDKACENSLYLMRQARLAIGPADKHRIKQMVVHWRTEDPVWKNLAEQEFSKFEEFTSTQTAINTILNSGLEIELPRDDRLVEAAQAGRIYVMDPWGYIMLSYPAVADEKESILKGKNLVEDLKRLLKVSKIG